MAQRHIQVDCYGDRNCIDIYRMSRAEPEFQYQVYINATHMADVLMNRDQIIKLRDALNEMLEG